MSLERYATMREAVQSPIKLNVIKNVTIRSKKYGTVDIYVVKPSKDYSLYELMLASVNNPKHIIYDKKNECFYINAYGETYLAHGSGSFFCMFLDAMKKQGLGADYMDACNKYLKEYARLCMESKDE